MNMIQDILKKFAPQLAKHGVKLSVEETAPEATKVEMMAEGALADGTMIYSNADAFAEGVEVFVMDADGNPIPLADGEYTMDNGMTIVVAAGIIESMAEAITEEPTVEIEVEQEDDLFKDSLEESERDIEKKEYQRRREELLLLGKAEVKKRLNAMGKRFPTIKMGENKGADEPMKRAASIILDKRNRNLTEEQILLLLG